MKEPKKIKLTESPESKKVNLIPLPPIDKYPDGMIDDVCTIKEYKKNEDNQQNNSQSIQQLESDTTD